MAIGSRRMSPLTPEAAAVFSDAMTEPRKVPCTQLSASVTSGTVGGAAAAEEDGVDRHALGVFPLLGDHRALAGGRGEAGVGMRGRAARLGRPVAAHPVDGVLGRGAHLLPPHVAVVGQRDVGVDAVGGERLHGVEVRLVRRARRHAEEARLRVDGIEPPVGAELHPADVIADGLRLPALDGRRQHGEVGLAAGGRERRRHELHPALPGW